MKKILVLIGLLTSCSAPPKIAGTTPDSIKVPSPKVSAPLCERLVEIKVLPFKGEPVNDSVYNELLAAGETALPCLIEKITDTTRMDDPRQAPKFNDVKVGDVAYFVLVRIAKLDFVEPLPISVREKYKEKGVYAYFEYVEKQDNREELRGELREWYRKKYGGGTTEPKN